MEKNDINKAWVDLDDYNELRDFKNEVEAGNVTRLYCNGFRWIEVFEESDDAVKMIAKENIKLQKKIDDYENPEKKQPTILELKKMNWWQLIRWRRG